MSEPIDPNAWSPTPPAPSYLPPYPPPAPSYLPPYPTSQLPQYQPYPPYGPVSTGATVPMLNESPPRSRRWMIAGIVAGAVLVAGALVAIVATADSGVRKLGPPLPVPVSVGRYTQRTDAVVDRVRAGLVQAGKSASAALRRFVTSGQLAIYGSGSVTSTPDLFMLMGRSADYPALSDATITNATFVGFGTPQSFDAGHFGGALSCASSTSPDEPPSGCAWADSTSTGFMFSLDASITLQELANLTNSARTTIDG